MKKYYKHVAVVALCLSVATSSFSQATSIFKVDFGTATPNDFLVKSVASPYASIGTGYISYNGTSAWAYGAYTYINNTNALRAYSNGEDDFNDWVVPGLEDHTPGDVDGRMLFVDGKQEPGVVYQTNIVGLCRDTYFNFSAWVANAHATFSKTDQVPQMQMEVWSKNPKFEENEFKTTYKTAATQATFCKGLSDGFTSANGAVLLTKGYHVIKGAPAYSHATLSANDDIYIYETTNPGKSNAQEVRYKVFKGSDGKYYCTSDGIRYYKATYNDKSGISGADAKRTTSTFVRDASFEYLNTARFTEPTHWTTESNCRIYKDNVNGRHFAYQKGGVWYQLKAASCTINGTTYYYPDFSDYSEGSKNSGIKSKAKGQINDALGLFTHIVYAYLNGSNLLFCHYHFLFGYYQINPNWEAETSYVLPSLTSTFTYKDDGNTAGRWEKINLQFKLTNQSNAYLIIRNFNDNSSGNDFVLDDIEFSPVDKYSITMGLSQALKEVEGYCSTGEIEVSSSISVKPYDRVGELTASELEAFHDELPSYVFFFEGYKDGEWTRINETPVKIDDVADPINYVVTIDDYKQYSHVRAVAYPSIFSAIEGCRLNVPDVVNPSDLSVPDVPVIVMEASDICPDAAVKKSVVTVRNTNYSDTQRWAAKVVLSDGTVVNVAE
ncbi:MAG: hypothetical protein IJP79_07565 [Paludibacteraceae bacterium]|nr:hypothetical protein [Paludibacteraceae bacterium]